MKTAFITHCSDDWFYNGGCAKLLTTASYFHPEIPFYVFGNIELNALNKSYGNSLNWCNIKPFVANSIADSYDKVIHFDSDCIILGKLDELLQSKEDIIGVRNNNDYNTASKFTDPPITVAGCKPEDYMNAGLVGSCNKNFWEEWMSTGSSCARYPYQEQDTYNLIIQSGKYSFECLDSKDKPLHYGISCHYGKDTYWDSAKEIIKISDDFMLKTKKVKVWHQAGGSHHWPKLNIDTFFSVETAKEIKKILENKAEYRKIVCA
jgi:lipopolysaccharide biosynthesis glycosyltransferase